MATQTHTGTHTLPYGQTRGRWRFSRRFTPQAPLRDGGAWRARTCCCAGACGRQRNKEALVRQRARWMREKLAQVEQPQEQGDVVTGGLRYTDAPTLWKCCMLPKLAVARLDVYRSTLLLLSAPQAAAWRRRARWRSHWKILPPACVE